MSDVGLGAKGFEIRDDPATRPHNNPLTITLNSQSQTSMAFTAMNNRPKASVVPVQAPVPTPAPTMPYPQEIDVAFASSIELRKRVHAAIGTAIEYP